jgi:hypothetical protein
MTTILTCVGRKHIREGECGRSADADYSPAWADLAESRSSASRRCRLSNHDDRAHDHLQKQSCLVGGTNPRTRPRLWRRRPSNLCRPRHGESVQLADMLYAGLPRFNLTVTKSRSLRWPWSRRAWTRCRPRHGESVSPRRTGHVVGNQVA